MICHSYRMYPVNLWCLHILNSPSLATEKEHRWKAGHSWRTPADSGIYFRWKWMLMKIYNFVENFSANIVIPFKGNHVGFWPVLFHQAWGKWKRYLTGSKVRTGFIYFHVVVLLLRLWEQLIHRHCFLVIVRANLQR